MILGLAVSTLTDVVARPLASYDIQAASRPQLPGSKYNTLDTKVPGVFLYVLEFVELRFINKLNVESVSW